MKCMRYIMVLSCIVFLLSPGLFETLLSSDVNLGHKSESLPSIKFFRVYLELFIISFAILVPVGIILSPFPYWPTYFLLWSLVFKSVGNWKSRYKQAVFLIKAAIGAPLWGLLWLADELIYPAYRKCDIHPVFIIGPPRCGTTLLHRTLAIDKETFFAVRHIEWRYPFIVVQKIIALFKIDKLMERVNYWPDTQAGRIAAKMHSNKLSDWEEDGIFFEENYLHHFFIFLRFPHPDHLEYFASFPELSKKTRMKILETHHKVLKKVLYLRGPDQRLYLSKEVTGHNKIPFLLEKYKDAKFILTVRFADKFMPSLIALARMSTLSKTGIEPVNIPGWQDAIIKRMQSDCRLLVSLCSNSIPPEHLVHVSANDYMQQVDIATEEIYHLLGLPFNKSFCDHLKKLRESQRKRDRGYTYDPLTLEGFEEYDQFVAKIREQFQKSIEKGGEACKGAKIINMPLV